MKSFFFRKGTTFIRGDRRFSVVRRLIDGRLQLESEDGELLNCSETEILIGCNQGVWRVDDSVIDRAVNIDIKISRDLSTFSKEVQDKVRKRDEYLTRIIKDGELVINFNQIKTQISQVAIDIGDSAPPSPITFYRWYKRKQKTGDSIIALADHFEKRGRRLAWSKEVKEVVDNAIETVYLNPQLYPKKAVCEEVERKLTEMRRGSQEISELRLPSQSSIYRYLDKLEAYNVAAARLGKQVAESKFRSVTGKQNASRLLERWEIDHTPIDSLIICEKSQLPIGRPWLTIILDKYSRMIVGFYISFRAPSAYAVLQCIKQAILPKDGLLKKFPDITMPWPAMGIPEMIVCDNGMDLHAKAITNICQELGIQIQFCPAKTPQYKGAVERCFRTISSDLMHQLPGSVFSNINKRGAYESEEKAAITFDTLEHLITKWIVEIYNQTNHRGLVGMTPLQKWEIGKRDRIIKHPVEPGYLEVLVGHSAKRRVFHYGVEINSLYYNSQYLQLLSRRHGEKLHVDIKYYEDDLSFIHVFDEDEKVYIKIGAIDREYTDGLRLVQHETIRQALREQSKDPDSRELLLQKKQDLQDIIAQSVHNKKMAKRKRSAVYQGRDNNHSIASKIDAYDAETHHEDAETELPNFNVDWREDIKSHQGSGS